MTQINARLELAKIIVGPSIALFVAAVGWLLTERYNANQLEIASKRKDQEIEVARINAALRYMEFTREIPEGDVAAQRQAITIAVPVLPPELAFRLAIGELPNEVSALDTLMTKYREDAYPYLAASLEIPFAEIKQTVSRLPSSSPYSEKPSNSENTARHVMQYLRRIGKAEQFFDFLVSPKFPNETWRPIALLFFFENYREHLKSEAGYVVQQAYQNVRIGHEFASLMSNHSLKPATKRAIAFSASIIFGQRYEHGNDIFSQHAAKYFWNGLDIARGGTPNEGTMASYIYSTVFHYNDPPGTEKWLKREAIGLVSRSLRNALLEIDFRKLDFGNIRLILYAYAESETVGPSAPYLMPSDTVKLLKSVLRWANTPERRRQLSMEFGSLGGDHLFRNMLPSCVGCSNNMSANEIAVRCKAAREFGSVLANWYSQYHKDDWYIPKFFYSVLVEFPELAEKIDPEKLGIGGPVDAAGWANEQSRGCRIS